MDQFDHPGGFPVTWVDGTKHSRCNKVHCTWVDDYGSGYASSIHPFQVEIDSQTALSNRLVELGAIQIDVMDSNAICFDDIPEISDNSCEVLESETLTWTGYVNCSSIIVHGFLEIGDDTYIDCESFIISSTGALQIGTSDFPAKNVTIFMHHADCQDLDDPADCLLDGQFISSGQVDIHGLPVTSWSLLNRDCDRCSTLFVDECDGWESGDEIVITTTGDTQLHFWDLGVEGRYSAEERIIASVAENCEITLNEPLNYLHR